MSLNCINLRCQRLHIEQKNLNRVLLLPQLVESLAVQLLVLLDFAITTAVLDGCLLGLIKLDFSTVEDVPISCIVENS
jgi:hypothetical protein